ncbi:MAG: flagellar biosynthetic protein FliR [Phycisphaerales bacterium]|nr:flagellar biosynthetic protein FliR [Phycisphaerales bacterium]
MTGFDALLPHLPPLLLVMTRLGGLFVFTPVLASGIIPMKAKALLVLTFSLAIYPTLDLHSQVPVPLDVMTLAPMMAGELLIGTVIGLAAFIPAASLQLAGLFMGQQMGLSIASVLNPAVELEGNSIGQILFYLGVATYTLLGGVDLLYFALLQTFDAVHLGEATLTDAPLDFLTALVMSGFVLATRIALPVVTIIFLESLAVGLIMKTVPSLNIMSFGFPIRIIVGLFVLLVSIVLISEAITGEFTDAFDLLGQWIEGMRIEQVEGR